jgi:hypothetical protein
VALGYRTGTGTALIGDVASQASEERLTRLPSRLLTGRG